MLSPKFILMLGLSLGAIPSLSDALAVSLPPGTEIEGSYKEVEGSLVALPPDSNYPVAGSNYPVTLSGEISPNTPIFVLKGRLGTEPRGIVIELQDEEGKFIPIATTLLPFRLYPLDIKSNGKVFPRHAIGISGGEFFVRPNPRLLHPKMSEVRKKEWEALPDAGEHTFTFEVRPIDGDQVEVWMDGYFLRHYDWPKQAVKFKVKLPPGAAVESLRLEEQRSSDSLLWPWQPLTSAEKRVEGEIKFFDLKTVPQGFQSLNQTRVSGLSLEKMGQVRGAMYDDLQSYFWRRNVSNRLEGEKLFSVPLATYSQAKVLCAIDPDNTNPPSFTMRVTRYGRSRGNAMADSIVTVPLNDAKDSTHAVQVGTVTLTPGGKVLPLWLVTVPIKNGLIQDILQEDTLGNRNFSNEYKYLDIELMEPLEKVEEADAFPPPMGIIQRSWQPTPYDYKGSDYFRSMPRAVSSSALIFGVLLEKSPASLVIRANTGLQVFYPSDNPEWLATVKADKAAEYTLDWDFSDVTGKIVTSGKQVLTLAAGAEETIKVPIKEGVGWYAVRFRLRHNKEELVDSRTSFVMLPPDTRKAGLESPYYGWWFQKNQLSDVKLSEAGPLLQRLGIRRAGLADDMPENESLKYGITGSTIEWGAGRKALEMYQSGKKPLPEVINFLEEAIREDLKKWPSIDRMNVFHESGGSGAPFPAEIWGESARTVGPGFEDENSPQALMQREANNANESTKSVNTMGWSKSEQEGWKKTWPARMQYLEAMAKMVREKFPQLKLQYGNDGNSLRIVGEIFRQKFPRKYIDTIAIEDLGQTITPESPRMGAIHSAWFLREVARRMGYGDIPITATTEWIGRMTERLGLETQAEWKVRDALLALAYGMDTISIGGLNDASSGYYQSIWANGGLCFRYPTMAPKPAYLAVAILTQVLDQAKFQRFVPTGSTVLYVQEFKHGDDWIYAIWTPRGTRHTTLEFPTDTERMLTDLYGRESKLQGKTLELTAGTAVHYLRSKDPVKNVVAGVAAFPEDPRPPKEVETTIPLESLSEISIISNKGREKKYFLREGEFELREVDDLEMGKCLELELKPKTPLKWDMEEEYAYLKLTHPVATTAKNAGIWVKGNGSWGQVDIWKSRSWGPWADNGNLHYNWPAQGKLNFDGWNFITFPYYDWVNEIQEGTPAMKNTVEGLFLTIPRKTIVGVKTVPVENLKIRFKGMTLF